MMLQAVHENKSSIQRTMILAATDYSTHGYMKTLLWFRKAGCIQINLHASVQFGNWLGHDKRCVLYSARVSRYSTRTRTVSWYWKRNNGALLEILRCMTFYGLFGGCLRDGWCCWFCISICQRFKFQYLDCPFFVRFSFQFILFVLIFGWDWKY